LAKIYNELLSNLKGISTFQTPSNFRHSYYKYTIKFDKGINIEKVCTLLKTRYKVETGPLYYPPIHLHPYYREHFGTCDGMFPVAEDALPRVQCLPLHAAMSTESVPYVTRSLADCIQESIV
jgi:dTDP-4-amino-4,6-dideoxygalactose transaminase